MKIGIITHYYKSINYGGNLQAYALCVYLNNLGLDAEQISYIREKHSIWKKKSFLRKIEASIYHAVLKLRSAMTNSIFQAELENLYIRKDAAYKDETEAARAVMHELVDRMESVSEPSASVQQKLLELALELRTVSGKKHYAYLKKPLKDKVDEIMDELEKLPEVAAYSALAAERIPREQERHHSGSGASAAADGAGIFTG